MTRKHSIESRLNALETARESDFATGESDPVCAWRRYITGDYDRSDPPERIRRWIELGSEGKGEGKTK